MRCRRCRSYYAFGLWYFLFKCVIVLAFHKGGWGEITLQCRDNDNEPVDWWYVYKPPASPSSFLEDGKNFTYMTSKESNMRWMPSSRFITSSMLQNTLSPMFRGTYRGKMAAMVYGDRAPSRGVSGTSANGILMADVAGGLWLWHTVPGMPDLTYDRPTFPESEAPNGHLMMCMSLSLESTNVMAKAIYQAAPNISYIVLPRQLRPLLPSWTSNRSSNPTAILTDNKTIAGTEIITKGDQRAVVIYRTPGEKQCIYKMFAKAYGLMLDVYGHTDKDYLTTVCAKNYGVRTIENISLKQPEKVFYIGLNPDMSRFAVSTATYWQKTGSKKEFWTCTSNLDKEDSSGTGGILFCVQDYEIWQGFDNLKLVSAERWPWRPLRVSLRAPHPARRAQGAERARPLPQPPPPRSPTTSLPAVHRARRRGTPLSRATRDHLALWCYLESQRRVDGGDKHCLGGVGRRKLSHAHLPQQVQQQRAHDAAERS